MLITKLQVKNYKSHSNTELSLSRVTLLGGRNDVGKTNLLEALFMLHDRTDPQIIFRHYGFRGLDQLSLTQEMGLTQIFYNYDVKNECSVRVTRDSQEEVLKLKYQPSYNPPQFVAKPITGQGAPNFVGEQSTAPSKALELIFKRNEKRLQLSHVVLNNSGVGMFIDNATDMNMPIAVFLPSRVRINPNEDSARFGALDVENKTEPILEALKIIEPRLIGLSAVSNGNFSSMYGDIGIGQKIPIPLMGDGLARFLSIILAIATVKNGIVLIDEIENGIHYSAMQKLWKGIGVAANHYNCQIVATTHSYECLGSAYKGLENMKEDFSYVRLDRKENIVVSRQYSYESLGAALSNNWEVR